MKLIVGLGNPDDKYKNTFHNLGFMVADKTAELFGATFNKTKCRALIAEARTGGGLNEKVLIAKPQTYMNLSGESVRELVSFYKTDLKDIFVIYDDCDIEKGEIRIREKGSAGTHNGMKNVVALLGSENFARMRIGFKQDGEYKIPLIDYVLSGISETDKERFTKATEKAANAAIDFANGKTIEFLMQKYNGKNQ